MSRQFEKEYTETNDRIHPRQELLQELEEKWAAQARQPEEKVTAFPVWARFVAAAAVVLLCVGVGMGSVMLYTRNRGLQPKSASAEAAVMVEGAADMAPEVPEEAQILYEAVETEEDSAENAEPVSMLAAAAPQEAPQGTHFALDEAEVEDAVRYDFRDAGTGGIAPGVQLEAPAAQAKAAGTSAPTPTSEPAPAAEETSYPAGKIIRRDDLYAVFLPTLQQIHVVEYANRRLGNVFSLTMKERGTEIEQVFWMGQEMLALRTRNGETELLRFDVSSWTAPRHLQNLTQSGTLLGAWEMGEGLCILSLCKATEEEPVPWVNGARLDFDRVLLDEARPGNTFALITLYEPGRGDDFAAATALLAPVDGAVEAGRDRLLLWAEGAETDLYALSLGEDGFDLAAEATRPGAILSAGEAGEGYSLLLQRGSDAEYVTLDAQLVETAGTVARGVGPLRFGQVYEGGAVLLTEDALHYLTAAGDRSLALVGDGFCYLTPDRGLVLSRDGTLQVVSIQGTGLEVLSTVEVRDRDLGLLLEDLSRLAFDAVTGRLVVPAGQNVYQYIIDEVGKITLRGEKQVFYDHDEVEQREIRPLLLEDQALLFNKGGVILCNHYLVRQLTVRY